MRGTTEESQTEDSWAMMRGLHHHGDEQIRALWRVARGFAESQDDMAFTAQTLSAITAPTLIVHGDRDPLFSLDIAFSMHDAIPTSWLWVVPNGGHLSLVAEGLSDQFVVTATTFLRGDWPSP
jgi:pimeloyl-ACP methyl ester carboxylesterase